MLKEGVLGVLPQGVPAGLVLQKGVDVGVIPEPHRLRPLLPQRFDGERYGVEFAAYDFRPRFQEGQEEARAAGLYLQKYCGCVYSEEERFSNRPQAALWPMCSMNTSTRSPRRAPFTNTGGQRQDPAPGGGAGGGPAGGGARAGGSATAWGTASTPITRPALSARVREMVPMPQYSSTTVSRPVRAAKSNALPYSTSVCAHPDVVVVDPPRKGLPAEVVEAIAGMGPDRVKVIRLLQPVQLILREVHIQLQEPQVQFLAQAYVIRKRAVFN